MDVIVDPHHHLWPGYLLPELREDIGALPVERTVFVDCMSAYRTDGPEALRPVGETEWVAGLGDPLIGGIVGHADLALGDAVEEVLAAHEEAGRGLFRGIRHATAWDPSPDIRNSHSGAREGLMGTPAFGAGIDALGRRGHSFDAWLYFPQIPELTALARAHPDVVMVLDHLGPPLGIGPYRFEESVTAWAASIADLATCANVHVKVGGIGMSLYGLDWHHRDGGAPVEELVSTWGPHLRRVIELFGADRCMFESNFPVDKRGCSYAALWAAFDEISSGYSPAERTSLFSGTATRVYRLAR